MRRKKRRIFVRIAVLFGMMNCDSHIGKIGQFVKKSSREKKKREKEKYAQQKGFSEKITFAKRKELAPFVGKGCQLFCFP